MLIACNSSTVYCFSYFNSPLRPSYYNIHFLPAFILDRYTTAVWFFCSISRMHYDTNHSGNINNICEIAIRIIQMCDNIKKQLKLFIKEATELFITAPKVSNSLYYEDVVERNFTILGEHTQKNATARRNGMIRVNT